MACASDTGFRMVTLSRVENTLAADVAAGLRARPKRLPCKFFYDAAGQALFERICELPEYYLTRTETAILRQHAGAILTFLPPTLGLVELGSGSSRKTRYLIEPLLRRQRELLYHAVDISPQALIEAGTLLVKEYARLQFIGLVGEFAEGLQFLARQGGPPRLVAFLGSTIGNFDETELDDFFHMLRGSLRPQDFFLLGFDLRKDPAVLIAAYDDAAGVTAEFNRNLLIHINRELGANFDVASFAHRAVFDDRRGRIEMHLISIREQTVQIPAIDLEVRFVAEESIHTENCYKHSRAGMEGTLSGHGFRVLHSLTDAKEMFCVLLAEVR
jgi:L-histidine N-alpha-methyltransferase